MMNNFGYLYFLLDLVLIVSGIKLLECFSKCTFSEIISNNTKSLGFSRFFFALNSASAFSNKYFNLALCLCYISFNIYVHLQFFFFFKYIFIWS